MKQYQIRFKNPEYFEKKISKIKSDTNRFAYSNITFHITWSDATEESLSYVTDCIERYFPDAVYFGNETAGSILQGVLKYDIIITCYVFRKDTTSVELLWVEKGKEYSSLEDLWNYCREKESLKAVELIPSFKYIAALGINDNVPDIGDDVSIFGGASMNFSNPQYEGGVMAKGHPYTMEGLVAVLYSGDELQISSTYVLGWKGLGKKMKVTDSVGKIVKTLDGQPAYSIYEKYLNLKMDDNATMVFPLIFEENGTEFIRAPLNILPDKSMQMFAEVPIDANVCISYGDKNTILEQIYDETKIIARLSPEAIKAYSCAGRRLFWGDEEISKETLILEDIARVSGFYTGGEILKFGNRLKILNLTLCVISFRENGTRELIPADVKENAPDKSLVSRLAYFVEKVTEEQMQAHDRIVEQQKVLRENIEIIGGLTSDYLALYYVNLKDRTFKVYSVDMDRIADTQQLLTQDKDPFVLLTKFACSSAVHPEDRQAFDNLTVDSVRKRLSGTKKFSIRFRRDYGQGYLWSVMDVVKYEGQDEEANAISIGFAERDREIRRELEQAVEKDLADRQRHITAFGDLINAGLWAMSITEGGELSSILFSNRFRHMLGFESEVDFPNDLSFWENRIHPEDRSYVIESLNKSAFDNSNGESFDVRYRLMKKNGEFCWYHDVGRIEQTDNGLRKMYGIIVDISADQRVVEQQIQLEKALMMAQSSNRSKTLFLNSMSHDIRTPMNAIINFTEMAQKYKTDPDKVSDYLAKISIAGNNLLELVNQVLDMSRIESGKVELEEVKVDIVEKVLELAEIIEDSAQRKGISIVTNINDVTDKLVFADNARINQLLMNIIGNSVKYTPEGGRIIFSLTQIPCEEKNRVSFSFTSEDNGIGMSKEFIATIFEPFSREKTTTVSRIQGSGLGMSIVKKIVEMMDGDIDIQSEQGEGTKITVKLTFRKADVMNLNDQSGVSADDFSVLKGKRVLLVEDNEMNREIAMMFLQESGIEIEVAEDGDIAVDMMRAVAMRNEWNYYDFILMDIQMPKMSGYTATAAIRTLMGSSGHHVPIIAMTANAFAEDRRKALLSGMDDHIAKPIEVKVLLKTLSKYA